MRILRNTLIALLIVAAVLAALIAGVVFIQLNNHPSLEPYAAYFEVPKPDSEASGQVTATFLGTSSLVISDGETSLMTDGFITRPSLAQLLWGELTPNVELITQALQQAHVTQLAAVIAVHSHHDHAMDSPEVALQTGALLLGSESTANIGRGWGLAEEQMKVAKPSEPLQFGKFSVTLIPSQHAPAPPAIEKLSGAGEHITAPLAFPASLSDFKEGGSYSVFISHPQGNILIQGSAGYNKGALAGYEADVVFLGIAGLGKKSATYREEYFQEMVTNVGAKKIIPIHWDDFTQPFDEPLQPQIRALDYFEGAMGFLIDKVDSDPGLELHMLANLGQIRLFQAP